MIFRTATPLALLLLAGAFASATQAQPCPSKPVHVIVPYPAGGVVDGLVRNIGQPLAEFLKADRANAKQVIARTGIRLEDSPSR